MTLRIDGLNGSALLPGVAVAVALAASPALAFTVDGAFDPGEGYTETLTATFNLTGGSLSSAEGALQIGRDGALGNIFLLLTVPTAIKDNTYGANTSIGWGTTSHAFDKAVGSEKWKFELDVAGTDETVELKLREPPSELKSDGSGAVLGGATSMDFNLFLFADPTSVDGIDLPQDSPPLPPPSGTIVTDQDQYDFVNNGGGTFQDWIFAQQYELEIDGSQYGAFTDLGDFAANISMAEVHASPNKADANNVTTVTFEPPAPGPDPQPVPEPATLALFGFGLAGLGLSHRRRTRGETH